jgi:hypothetical protein
MSQQNQIVDRLMQQKSRIFRMFSPGSKMPRKEQASWNFSPVAPDFGGRKFQQAAEKMRVLGKGNLSRAKFEKVARMAETIQAKFANVKNMLHISSAESSKESSWSAVETVFPNRISGRFETPLEPGELRSGSVIQKFNTFPQAGQSLESFKDQVQRSPIERKPEAHLPKRAAPSPKDKLFSRVQELTNQKEKKNIKQDESASLKDSNPALSEISQQPMEQVSPPVSPLNATIQKKGETPQQQPVERFSPSVPSEVVQRKEEPARQISQPPSGLTERVAPLKPVEDKKTEIARALPVQSIKPDSSKLPIAFPVKKPDSPARFVKQTVNLPDVPSVPRSLPSSSSSQIVQRQPEAPKPIATGETQQETSPHEPDLRPNVGRLSVESPQEEKSPEMPLQRQLDQKRNAYEMMRSGASRIRPAAMGAPLKPTMVTIQRSLLPPTTIKHYEALSREPQQTLITQSGELPLQRLPNLSTTWESMKAAKKNVSETIGGAVGKVSTPVKSAMGHVDKSFSGVMDVVSDPIHHTRMTLAKKFGGSQQVESADGADSSSGESAPAETASTQGSAGTTNMTQLAEQVFPLVKHLLELESERTGSRFR